MASLYSQHQLPVPDQIALLQSEGLIIDDYDKTLHTLTHISMSRLKGYLFPFRVKGGKTFKPGASFVKAYRLYKFDSKLRKLIFAELEKIEVSIRTQLSLVMSDVAGAGDRRHRQPALLRHPAHRGEDVNCLYSL